MIRRPPQWLLFVSAAVLLVLSTGPSEALAQRDTTVFIGENPWGVHEVKLDTVRAGRFDNGKMWTFEAPPVDYFAAEYDLRPDSAWFEQAREGALRIPGCSASFASAQGLVVTNHHCGRDHATSVSQPGENILQNGFYAPSLADERRVEDLYADQLIAITDVTDEMDAALNAAQTDAERSEARQQAAERIQTRLTREHGGADAGIRTEVTALYSGGRYSAYTYRRYEDVRLVMIPELQLGYFGGDTDNFTYPRYALDMSLFRVYDESGDPLETEHYFPWAEDGSQRGDPVFVVGNPGSTLRLETVAQLRFRRDIQDQAVLNFYASRVEALRTYAATMDTVPDELQNRIFGLENALKLYRGRMKALKNPYIIARRRAAESDFRQAIDAEASLRRSFGGLLDSMATVQAEKREYGPSYQAFLALQNPGFSAATLRRAFLAVQYLSRKAAGGDEPLSELRAQLTGVPAQPDALERSLLTARLHDLQTYFGTSDSLVQQVLQDEAPGDVADRIIRTSVLSDSARTAVLVQQDSLSRDDPAVQLAAVLLPRYQEYSSAFAGLNARQQEVARQLGQARYAAYGTDVPPDATFTLRLADGRVQSYPYNGTTAPPYTTFYGLLSHYHAHGAGSEWDLPAQWSNLPDGFERSTPINLVSTNDITGGNSGSPLLNEDLELVGLIFDGNIESLAGDYLFMPDRGMRAISVDVRGMLEALDMVYDADRLVLELTEEAFVPTEQAADARAARTP